MKRANDNMKQIRSDELWGNYSIAGKSTTSFAAARLTSTSKARRVCERICERRIGVKIEKRASFGGGARSCAGVTSIFRGN